ncbi:MAG: hypothetical protein PVJ45_07480 [Desulfobacterales bacterium]|jgi:hypothetical protein
MGKFFLANRVRENLTKLLGLNLRIPDVKYSGKHFKEVYDPAGINLKASIRRKE